MTHLTEEVETSPQEQLGEDSSGNVEHIINPEKLNLYMEQLKLEQNLLFGLASGSVAAVVGAAVWAVITVSTGYQIGYMAVAVGLLVGFVIKRTGKGVDKTFGIFGAILALGGCLLGNLLSIIGFVANEENISYLDTLLFFDYNLVPDIMVETFSPMDLLFYGIAIYQGYKFSFREITEQEIIDHAAEPVTSSSMN